MLAIFIINTWGEILGNITLKFWRGRSAIEALHWKQVYKISIACKEKTTIVVIWNYNLGFLKIF